MGGRRLRGGGGGRGGVSFRWEMAGGMMVDGM